MRFGVDVSEFQTGIAYARAVNEGGVKFAILRGGYSREKDAEFETHWQGFSAAGVPLGVYQYSYAKNAAAALEEAEAAAEWCRGKQLALPVFLDMEEGSVAALGKEVCTAIAMAWCGRMAEKGLRPGIYASAWWWERRLDREAIRAKYACWCADWSTDRPDWADLWQFGGETNLLRSTRVAGVSGTVDQNYLLNEGLLTETPEKTEAAERTDGKGETIMVELELLGEGSEGAQVKTVQRLLMAMGYSVGSAGADGIFGGGTLAGVLAFQKDAGIGADGLVGNETWGKLLKG